MRFTPPWPENRRRPEDLQGQIPDQAGHFHVSSDANILFLQSCNRKLLGLHFDRNCQIDFDCVSGNLNQVVIEAASATLRQFDFFAADLPSCFIIEDYARDGIVHR